MAFRLSFFTGVIGSAWLVVACGGGTSHRSVPESVDAGTDGSASGGAGGKGGSSGGGGVAGNGGNAGGGGTAGSGGAVDAGAGGASDASLDGSTTHLDGSSGADASGAFTPGVVGVALPASQAPACPVRLALDSSGAPFVAYVNKDTAKVEVSHLVGSTWTPLGAITMTGSVPQSHCPSLTVDPSGRPVVSFQEIYSGNQYQVEVQRWNGSSWNLLGAVMPSQYGAPTTEIASDANGRIVLATLTNGEVDFRSFDGTDAGSWPSIGLPFHRVQPYVGDFRFVLGPDGNPVVITLEGTGGSNAAHVYVTAWSGSAWTNLGGELDSTPDATQSITPPNIAYGNAPVVSWVKKPGDVLNLRRWDGTNWVDVEPVPADGHYYKVAIAAAGDRMTIAWGEDGGNFYQQFDGTTWGQKVSFHGPDMVKVPEPLVEQRAGRLYMTHMGAGDDAYVLRLPLP